MNIRKGFFVGLGLALFTTFVVGFYFTKDKKFEGGEGVIKYSLAGKTYKLPLADEPEEWERGLMFVRQPKGFEGMLFVFPDRKIRQFWNKNTFVDLEVYWIAGDRVVGKGFLPSIEKSGRIVVISSPEPVDKVVEIIRP